MLQVEGYFIPIGFHKILKFRVIGDALEFVVSK